MSLFRLDASINPATSATRALGDIVEAEWTAAHSESTVVRRDLAADPIPATAWQNALAAATTEPADRTPEQAAAHELATSLSDELVNADALLFTVPLYNYGVSQHVKTWFDLVYTDPRTSMTGTALRGKPAVLATALGGNYSPGTPREGWDHATAWLRRVFVDVWGLDLQLIERPFTLVGVNPALDQFADMAAQLRADAEAQAHEAGRTIARDRAA